MKIIIKTVRLFFFWLFTFVMAIVVGTGVAGGIMYLNEKLNQFGTILIGG